jgi:hypothetical protein
MSTNQLVSAELNSTTLTRVAYQMGSALLELEFRDGSVYHYAQVPEALHHDLLRADSPGLYFNLRIRGRFPHLRVRPPR